MQDRPAATELLDALGDFMRDRAANSRDRWERFQFQVAANSLGVLMRELQLEDGFIRDEWRGLDTLIGEEPLPDSQAAVVERMNERNEELVARIQEGRFDGDAEDPLVRHLFETVMNKVRIASPNEAL